MKRLIGACIGLSIFFLSGCSLRDVAPITLEQTQPAGFVHLTGTILEDSGINYIDNEVGFHFTYPKNCKIIEDLEKESSFSGGIKYSDCIIEIVVINNDEINTSPLDVYLKREMLLNSALLSSQLSVDDVKAMLNTTKVNDIETVRLHYFIFGKMNNGGVYLTEDLDGNGQYIFKKGDYVVFLTPYMWNSDGSPDGKNVDKIISSIKFGD